jgi:hypothetical protein
MFAAGSFVLSSSCTWSPGFLPEFLPNCALKILARMSTVTGKIPVKYHKILRDVV